ncbi:hypothetical protein FACS1894193_08910 [Bacilli bacterium]|nr:hypothetical protein FACS1894193_08910 [Bacilli bacterium]
MENLYPKNKITFPIMPDDAVLTPDNRVIMTNQQLLTRNPDMTMEHFGASTKNQAAGSSGVMSESANEAAGSFEMRRQTPTVNGKRPLSKNFKVSTVAPPKKKSTLVEEARKRALENAVAPKPVKPYVNPLERATSDELGIKGLANKKVVQSQHSLGKPVSGFDKTAARQSNGSLFDAPKQDYFASKHQHRDGFDTVD